jgi:hypothetical protein
VISTVLPVVSAGVIVYSIVTVSPGVKLPDPAVTVTPFGFVAVMIVSVSDVEIPEILSAD